MNAGPNCDVSRVSKASPSLALAGESFSAKRRGHIATDEELAEWLGSPPSLDDVVTLQRVGEQSRRGELGGEHH